MLDLHKKINQNKISPLYLLYGKESYLIEETKQKIVSAVLNEEELDFNLSVYDMEETSVDLAIEEAETLPFMGEKRVVLIKNPIFLTAQKDKTKVEHNVKRLEAYLENPSPDTVLLFIANYEKLDERKKLVKLLKKTGDVLEATSINEQLAEQWITNKAHDQGVDITDSARELLVQLTGTRLMMLSQEVDKMMMYVGPEGTIDDQVVETLVSRTLEQNIFELVDKVVKKQLPDALRIYYDLLRQKEEPIKILALFAQQFRMLLHVQDLSKRGYNQKQIAGTLKVHPYRVKLAANQANSFPREDLLELLDQLAEADYKMKTGQGDKEMILELFIMNLKKQPDRN